MDPSGKDFKSTLDLKLVLVAAVARSNVIGNKGRIPWSNIPDDMKRFKAMTMGCPVIMGKTTYLSISDKFRPLEGRTNLVLSRDKNFNADGIVVCRSIGEALEKAAEYNSLVNIIGGQSVYEQTINLADRLELTEIDKDYQGDAFFPHIDKNIWQEAKRVYSNFYSFVSYWRKNKFNY